MEDSAARERRIRAAKWVIAGGTAAFVGSLLPFLSSAQPDLYQVNSSPQDTATFFGIVLAALGTIMLVKSGRAKLISAVLTLIAAGLTELTLCGITVAGMVGTDQADPFGDSVHVTLSPQVGILVSILGCAAAGIGAIMSARRR